MIVIVHCVFIFIVFVGEGSMSLVPAHLPHLRVLGLEQCSCVNDECIDMIVAAVPELVVVKLFGEIVGGLRGGIIGELKIEQLKNPYGFLSSDGYDILRQWALDK
jgi:hypothetical protein